MKKPRILVMLPTILALGMYVISFDFSATNAQEVIIQDGNNCSIEKEGFKLCVESTQIEAKTNQDVWINFLLLNLSEKKLLVGHPPIYEYKAANDSGESLETVFDKQAKKELGYLTDSQDKTGWRSNLRGGSSARTFINPQERQKDEINLSKIYDFTTPGKYIISIKRNLPSKDRNGFIELVINKIEIEVKD
jgi:hypothetical protein